MHNATDAETSYATPQIFFCLAAVVIMFVMVVGMDEQPPLSPIHSDATVTSDGEFFFESGFDDRDDDDANQPDMMIRNAMPRVNLEGDKLGDVARPEFDPSATRRQRYKGWQINVSSALMRLDMLGMDARDDAHLLKLRSSYRQAVEEAGERYIVLPSANLINGKAKQFDDGLFAAVDLFTFSGGESAEGQRSQHRHVLGFANRLAAALPPGSDARAYLEVAIWLSNPEQVAKPEVTPAVQELFAAFEQNAVNSKPVAFYEWTDELERCFRSLRFMQLPLDTTKTIPNEIVRTLRLNAKLAAELRSLNSFYAKLTNPPSRLSPTAGVPLLDMLDDGLVAALQGQQPPPFVCLFPRSLCPSQLLEYSDAAGSSGVDSMRLFIELIRSGKVDLSPKADSGWYGHQLHAIEPFVLPETALETVKLIRTREYKEQLLETFKTIITKTRETHERSFMIACGCANPGDTPQSPLPEVQPELRLEPCTTHYLRIARSYRFLQSMLVDSIGQAQLSKLHGLRAGGKHRPMNLAKELEQQIQLFYGFALVSAEDIGLKPELHDGEFPKPDIARHLAESWLRDYLDDPDMAVDTRVIIPVVYSQTGTHVWGTGGVQLTKLFVRFEDGHTPRMRLKSTDDWRVVPNFKLKSTVYLLPIDVSLSSHLPAHAMLSRTEFRRLCDQCSDRAGIERALRTLGRRQPAIQPVALN